MTVESSPTVSSSQEPVDLTGIRERASNPAIAQALQRVAGIDATQLTTGVAQSLGFVEGVLPLVCRDVESLLRVVEAQAEDSKRLAWLVEHFASFGSTSSETICDGKLVASESRYSIFVRVPCNTQFEWHCYDGTTWRDAIDAAMQAPPCGSTLGECAKKVSDRLDVQPPVLSAPGAA